MSYRYKITSDYKAQIVSRLRKEKITYWELGKYGLFCHENTVARMIRDVDSDDKLNEIMAAIDKVIEIHEHAV